MHVLVVRHVKDSIQVLAKSRMLPFLGVGVLGVGVCVWVFYNAEFPCLWLSYWIILKICMLSDFSSFNLIFHKCSAQYYEFYSIDVL